MTADYLEFSRKDLPSSCDSVAKTERPYSFDKHHDHTDLSQGIMKDENPHPVKPNSLFYTFS